MPALFTAAASGGYGVTESQVHEGAHHRIEGVLAAAVAPLPELGVSLALDGRYDRHPGGDDGAVGVPRLTVLGTHPLSERLRLGAALSLALACGDAPSLDFSAPVLSALALASLQVRRGPLLSAQLGVRFDGSAAAAPDHLERLSPADRMALGLSDFDAIPIGISALTHVGEVQLAGELSGELLVGKGAPKLIDSPLRASAIGRMPLARGVLGELRMSLSLSDRPKYNRITPLIPLEPRFTIALGLRFAPAPAPAIAAPKSVMPIVSELRGVVVDDTGSALPAIDMTVQVGSRTYTSRTAADGSFVFAGLPREHARLQSHGEGYTDASLETQLDRALVEVTVHMTRSEAAQLRGLVRSFAGTPLPAQVSVLPAGASVSADKDGRFVLDLAPGVYQVEIACDGYLTQRRKVTVQDNGVTVLNVELREAQR
jgi:hypothetical protein